MDKITYSNEHPVTGSIKVTLGGTYVGSIVRNGPHLWHYQPKGRGTRPGESMNSISAVQRSLATDTWLS